MDSLDGPDYSVEPLGRAMKLRYWVGRLLGFDTTLRYSTLLGCSTRLGWDTRWYGNSHCRRLLRTGRPIVDPGVYAFSVLAGR